MSARILQSCEPVKAEHVQGRQFWTNPLAIKMRRPSGDVVGPDADWRSDGISWPSWIFGAIGVIIVAAVFGYLAELPIWVPAALGAWAALLILLWLFQPRTAMKLLGFLHDWACQNTALFSKADRDAIFREAAQALKIPVIYWWPMLKWVSRGATPAQWPQPGYDRIDSDAGVEWQRKPPAA